ncbi:MAG: T9SS type A sorting domain-containing protein [Ferruginibacter sp.]
MKKISTPQTGITIRLCLIAFLITFFLSISKTSSAYEKQNFRVSDVGLDPDNISLMTGTLPVVLTPLKGYYSKGVSHLYWKSLQESNSSHFEIERSNDGTNFVMVGRVTAKSISDKEVDYSFDDIRSNAGLNYYRLKLLDKDGRFQYSNIELLNVNIEGINITAIYPAPFIDKVNVVISSEVKTQSSISLFDNTGKLLINQPSVLNKGVTNLVVDNLSNLVKGLYIIKVQVGENIVIKKLIK